MPVKLHGLARLLPVALALAAATALTGCHGDSDRTALSESEAGERYVKLVEPVNAAAVALQAQLTADPPHPPEIQKAASTYVDASNQFREDAEDTQWPESVDDDITFLISSNGRALDDIRALERVQTGDDLQLWAREHAPAASSALSDAKAVAGEIRKELGLPTPTTPAS